MQILLLLLSSFFLSSCTSSVKTCSRSDAMAAEAATANLSTWPAIQAAAERYVHCDDGAIAQSFTQSVVHKLATDWGSLAIVANLISQDPAFGKFVLSHIDATADPDELEQIAGKALSECPPSFKAFCGDVHAVAKKSLAEL